jgi:hypothetical protein
MPRVLSRLTHVRGLGLRPLGLRALRQGGAWEAFLAEYHQGVADLALGGERAEPPAASLGGRIRRRFLQNS